MGANINYGAKQSNTCASWWLGTARQFSHSMHWEGGSALIADRCVSKLCENNNKASDTLNTNPRSGQYLTHAHNHITRAVAAMDSCFGLVALCSPPFTAEVGAKQ